MLHRRARWREMQTHRSGDRILPLDQLKALLFRKKLRRRLRLTEDHVLSVLHMRRARSSIFGENLFSDPAWDILLELYAAKLGDRRMTLSELAQATETPPSATGRWIGALEERGLIRSTIDPGNPAGVNVGLTAKGASKMERLGDHWGSAFLSI